jgi:hypothetical protein
VTYFPSIWIAIGDEEGVNCGDDDSLYQQGDKRQAALRVYQLYYSEYDMLGVMS